VAVAPVRTELTIPRPEVEHRVLRALQDKLMRQDFFEEFCREFAKEMNRLRMEQRAGLSGAKRELERVNRDIQKVIEAIKAGFALPELKVEMDALQARKEVLLARLSTAQEPAPLLHPSMADLYRSKGEDLASALQREDTRLEASEMLRGLIEAIVFTPQDGHESQSGRDVDRRPKNNEVARIWRPHCAGTVGCGGRATAGTCSCGVWPAEPLDTLGEHLQAAHAAGRHTISNLSAASPSCNSRRCKSSREQ
jgi:hypothetical protein